MKFIRNKEDVCEGICLFLYKNFIFLTKMSNLKKISDTTYIEAGMYFIFFAGSTSSFRNNHQEIDS